MLDCSSKMSHPGGAPQDEGNSVIDGVPTAACKQARLWSSVLCRGTARRSRCSCCSEQECRRSCG